jgi:hypothetical protein
MRTLFPALGFLVAIGCGPSEPSVYPVSGTLKLGDGKSPAGCVVEFSSQAEATKGLNARGEVGADGTFALKTTINGKEKAGAVAGSHKVVVVPPAASSTPGAPVPPAIPTRYMEYAKSGLTAEVKPEGANAVELKLDAK